MNMNPVSKAEEAFSLIEICLVLAVIATIAAFSVPTLSSSMRSMQLSADARNIASSLMDAKLSATSKMNPYRLNFNLAGKQWAVEKFNRATNAFDVLQTYSLSSGVSGTGITFKSNSSAALPGYPAASSNLITFNSRGIPVDAGGVPTADNVVYVSKSDTDLAITVSLSGKTQVWRYKEGAWHSQ
jgi:Tfp pilus assembly protein FimT